MYNIRPRSSLGTEGETIFLQKSHHVEVSKKTFKEIVLIAAESFERMRSKTYEKYKLFNKTQEQGKTLEASDADLTQQPSQ